MVNCSNVKIVHMYACVNIHVLAYICIYTRTYIRTYTHTRIYVRISEGQEQLHCQVRKKLFRGKQLVPVGG